MKSGRCTEAHRFLDSVDCPVSNASSTFSATKEGVESINKNISQRGQLNAATKDWSVPDSSFSTAGSNKQKIIQEFN